MKKILILIGSLISALVLFICISFNTNVYAYDTSFYYGWSKSISSASGSGNAFSNFFTLDSNFTYIDHDNIERTGIYIKAKSLRSGAGTNFNVNFTLNDYSINEPFVLLINWSTSYIADSSNGDLSPYTCTFRGSSQSFNGRINQNYYKVLNTYYSYSSALMLYVNNSTLTNTFTLSFQNYNSNTDYVWLLINNIDLIPISQLSSSLYFVNYASGLQSMYDNLLSDYNDLNDSYEDLESDYSTLESSYSSLESQYNTLLTNYNTLQNNYNDLVDNYGEMFQQYEDLQTEFESLSNAVDDIKRYSYLYYLFNDVSVYTLANIDWHDVTYNYYRSDVTSAKQLIDTLNKDYTYTQDSGFWYYDKVNLVDDSQKIMFNTNNIPNNLPLLKNDSNFVDLLSSEVAYYFDVSNLGYNGFIEMLFDIHNWSEQVLYNYTIQVLYDNNNVITYDLSSYLSDNNLTLNSIDDYYSLGFELSPSAIGIYIKANDNGDFYPNSLYVATDTWYYNSGYSAGVQSQAITISNLSSRITDLNNVIVTLRKTIQDKDEQISNNFGWQQFFGGMADIPFLTIFNFMNVDILGFNLFQMFAGIITALAFLWLMKKLH